VDLRAARRGTEIDTAAKLSANTGGPQPQGTPRAISDAHVTRAGLPIDRAFTATDLVDHCGMPDTTVR